MRRYFGVEGRDQRLHGRVPGAEPRPRARRGHGARGGVRPRFQRAAREGGASAGLAARLDAPLALRPRARRVTGLFILLAPWVMGLFGPYERVSPSPCRGCCSLVVLLMGVSGIVTGDPQLATRSSPSRRSCRSLWNLAIIVSLVVFVPQFDSVEAQLYVYAGGILAGTVIQAITPVWWLRGRDGRIRAVLDLRDPAVKRVFAPDAAGDARCRAHQLQPRHQHVLRRAFRRPGPRVRARSTRRFASTCSPRGCSRSPSPPSSSRACRASPPATTSSGFARRCRSASARSGSSCCPRAPSARCSRFRSRAFCTSAAPSTPSETRVVAGDLAAFALGLTFNGTMLMLNRAFFSLQSAWVPTAIALGNLALNVVLNAVLYRVGIWGIPLATSIVNIAGTARAPRHVPQAPRPDRRPRARVLLRPITIAAAGAAGAAYRSLVRARRAARPLARRPDRPRWGSASWRAAAAYLGLAALIRVRELQTLLRCGGDQLQRARNELARPHPQLLDRRAHRPRQVDAGRPRARGDADALRARDARAGARLDGARARARHHDQGAGRPRRCGAATSST